MSDLLFEYKVRARHRLGWKEFTFYATTDIEEFLNRNSIDYVRNATDTVENRLFKENKQLKYNWNKLKEWLENNWIESQDIWFGKIINKMQEIEQGSDKEC